MITSIEVDGFKTLREVQIDLLSLDLIVMHVDADVAGMNYQDAGTDAPLESDLPCEEGDRSFP